MKIFVRETERGEVVIVSEDDDYISIPCVNCGKMLKFHHNSYEAKGTLNAFCKDTDCEDKFAARL